tara:strand:+ start:58 stop:282 length:225 start_codon:yes stop_codon:yes gene_type:complete
MVRTKRPGGPLQQREIATVITLAELQKFDSVEKHNVRVYLVQGYTFLVANCNGKTVGHIKTWRDILKWVDIAQG